MDNTNLLEHVDQVISTWLHNRLLYPGWLVFPPGEERQQLRSRTDAWEPSIINALPELAPVKRLQAICELIWRRGILLEPINPNLEAAAEDALLCFDPEKHTVDGVKVNRNDWTDIQKALKVVVIALIRNARLDCNKNLFDKRIDALVPFTHDDSEIEHRIHHEKCLWAAYSLDFDQLNQLLENWTVKICDPVWMLRKAAMLSEMCRYEESAQLIHSSLESLRSVPRDGNSIANVSRESWALASTLKFNNRQMVYREWENLAPLKCDPRVVIDDVRRTMKGTTQPPDAPPFDVGLRLGAGYSLSNSRHTRLIAAYRAVLLPEVTGLPLINNPETDTSPEVSMVSDLLASAAEELVSTNPQLSMRLALRISTFDQDKSLGRVFSRQHLATLSHCTLKEPAQICFKLIQHARPLLFASDEYHHGISWVERMRVAVEILSRLVLRLSPRMVCEALDLALDCYRCDQFTRHPWLALPLNNLLERSWEALPQNLRSTRVFDLLTAPIKRSDVINEVQDCLELGTLIEDRDMPARRTPENEELYHETVELIEQALRSDNVARGRAVIRLLPLATLNVLSENERSMIADALWDDVDSVFINSQDRNSPSDWIFIVLPEKEGHDAEQAFRQKWLTSNADGQNNGVDYSINLLTQVHSAIFGLRTQKRSFPLSTVEEQHIARHIEILVEMFSSDPVRFHFGIKPDLLCISELATAITIPDSIASNIFSKIDKLLKQAKVPWDFGLGDYRITLGFAVIPGLIKVMPDCFDSLCDKLRTGLASEDSSRITGAMAALRSWLSASLSSVSNLNSVPDYLIREVGMIIASDRRTALADALSCAISVFDNGTQTYKEAIGSLVLQGLAALAEKLQYVHSQESAADGTGDDLPTLRFLCGRLTISMARSGFDNDATIKRWLEICRDDPFPEIRNVVITHTSVSGEEIVDEDSSCAADH